MYRDLRSFVEALEREGELERVSEPVSPVLEITRRTDAESKRQAPGAPSDSAKRSDPRYWDMGGRALLFENVEGSPYPLLINAFGSYRRMEMALGRPLADIAGQIGELVKPQPPRGLGEAIAKAKQFAPVLKIGPKRAKTGLCQEAVETGDQIDLTKLPIIKCWPYDGDFAGLPGAGYPAGVNEHLYESGALGHPEIDRARWDAEYRGRYITLAGIHTVHADDAGSSKPSSHNIGMYRVQLLGKNRVAMHWHMHHDGARHWRSWVKKGEPMPVAIALGGESVLPYAATAPLPPGISELLMSGFLNGGGMRLCPAKTVPLMVPANAEFVIEGYVSPNAGPIGWDPREPSHGELGPEAVFEGPFGDHTGFYSMPDRYPIVNVTAVTRRANPIYPTTIVGLPPQEDYFLGKATERLFLPLLQVLIPDIADYDLPMFGAFHNCAFVQIEKHYPLQARRVMHAIWGAGQMAWTKTIFVVDQDVDVHDQRAVMEACARWCDPRRDLEIVNGPLDILDHAAPRLAAGGKLGFDCTRPWLGEEVNGVAVGDTPRDPLTADNSGPVCDRVSRLDGVIDAAVPHAAPGWLMIQTERRLGDRSGAGLGVRVLEAALAVVKDAEGPIPSFIVALGRGIDPRADIDGLFHWVANMDPLRDTVTANGTAAVGFDATPKTPEDTRLGQPVRAWPPVLEIDAG